MTLTLEDVMPADQYSNQEALALDYWRACVEAKDARDKLKGLLVQLLGTEEEAERVLSQTCSACKRVRAALEKARLAKGFISLLFPVPRGATLSPLSFFLRKCIL